MVESLPELCRDVEHLNSDHRNQRHNSKLGSHVFGVGTENGRFYLTRFDFFCGINLNSRNKNLHYL